MRAGAVLIAALCAVLPAVSGAGPRIPKAFAHAVPALRIVTFPVLLPTTFDGIDLDRDRVFAAVDASAHHYAVQVNLAPDCNGANVCSAGSIEGYDAVYRRAHPDLVDPVTPRTPDADDRVTIRRHRMILDMRVPLARGLTGLYSEAVSGADDGGNSTLRWNDRGIEYALVTRISDRAQLIRIADSAIRNGPL